MARSTSNELNNAALPSVRCKPSYEKLCKALQSLEIQPNNWSGEDEPGSTSLKSTNDYLLSIISSDLAWFDTEQTAATVSEQRDRVWDLAGKRMSERCGRSAMPEMSRTWIIPASKTQPELKIEIREPSLTGDQLGLKTWGTAFALAKRLEHIGSKYFEHLIKGGKDIFTTSNGTPFTRPKMRVLELGSGTGLVGIAVAALWGIFVILTDLPEIHDNLKHNVEKNRDLVHSMHGMVAGSVLNWKNTKDALAEYGNHMFEAVIAADPLYDDDHPELVGAMVRKYLKFDRFSRALIAIPMRDKTTRALARKLINYLRENGLQLNEQGEEVFKDDWRETEEGGIKFWWSIWGWAIPWTAR